MRHVHLSGIDLNLLVALDALLRERSVTRAAASVGLSQPAMSRSLGRLRALFEDPLLVRSGHAMVPTPRALALSEPLGASLQAIRRTLDPPSEFDPATAQRSFILSAIDTTQAVVLPPLLEHIRREAPGIDVGTAPLHTAPETFAQLAAGERDLAVGRFKSPPDGIRCSVLYQDRIVCLVRRDHPRVRRRLTMKRYLAESHLAAESFTPHETPFTIESLLAKQDLTRRVVCTVEKLAIAPILVAGTDLVCTAPGKTIAPFAAGLGVRALAPPFEAPGFDLQIAWHERNDEDRGHRWLRGVLRTLFQSAEKA